MDLRFDTSRDPRFKRAPRQVRKIQVDDRFKRMFTDERFTETARVTPQGRRRSQDTGARNLRAFYEEADDRGTKSKKRKEEVPEEDDEEDEDEEDMDEVDEDAEENEEEIGSDSTAAASSTDIGSDDEDEEEDADDEGPTVWDDPEKDVPRGDATKRIAMMGCDWDRVDAGDIMVLMRTYLSSASSTSGRKKGGGKTPPSGAAVTSVRIYPSDYGLARLAKEAESGPVMEVNPKRVRAVRKRKARRGDDEDPDEEEENIDPEAIRLWEQERTKYYYGVIECNSAATACWLYDEMDGEAAQALCPGNVDLRFVPDDLEFPHAPTSEATKIPAKYKAPDLLTSGQSHTTSKCNWDEGPAHRKKDLMRKRFSEKELAEMDLKAYMDSSESEEGDEDAGDLKKLIDDGLDEDSEDGGKDEEFNGNMEATFNLEADKLAEDLQDRAKQLQKSSGPMKLEREEKSAWQKYLDNRKAKRKERKAAAKAKAHALKNQDADESGDDSDMLLPTKPKDKKKRGKKALVVDAEGDVADDAVAEDVAEAEAAADLQVLAMDADASEDRGFNLRGPKKKKGKKKQAAVDDAKPSSFAVDTTDPRIASVFTHPDFAIDPTHTEFRSSEGMATFLAERRKRRKLGHKETKDPGVQQAKDLLAEPVKSQVQEAELPPLKTNGGLKLFSSSKKKTKRKGIA